MRRLEGAQRRLAWWARRRHRGHSRGAVCGPLPGTGPEQAALRIVNHMGLRVQEFVLQRGQLLIIQCELELEGPIGHPPAPLHHGKRLVENLLKSHCPPSRGRCGVQKTVWEVERPFGHMYTAYGCQKKAEVLEARDGAVAPLA